MSGFGGAHGPDDGDGGSPASSRQSDDRRERGAILVIDGIQGGGLLTLDADGTPVSCRLEADGSVTVFGEFAN